MGGLWLWPILLVTIVQKGGLERQSGYQDLILFVMVGSQQANQEKKIKRGRNPISTATLDVLCSIGSLYIYIYSWV